MLFELEDGVMLFPENLYECSSYSQFEFQQLQVEVRNLDVYLGILHWLCQKFRGVLSQILIDMYMNISPITLSRNIASAPQPKAGFFRVKDERDPKNYIYIDGNKEICTIASFLTSCRLEYICSPFVWSITRVRYLLVPLGV